MSAGFFLWGSYALTFVLLALEVFFLVRRTKKCERATMSRAAK